MRPMSICFCSSRGCMLTKLTCKEEVLPTIDHIRKSQRCAQNGKSGPNWVLRCSKRYEIIPSRADASNAANLRRSSRVAGSKRWAVVFYFPVRIWYILSIKCREKSDLGVCMTSVLAKRMRLCSADFRRILRPNSFWNQKSALCGGIFFASTEVMQRPSPTLSSTY